MSNAPAKTANRPAVGGAPVPPSAQPPTEKKVRAQRDKAASFKKLATQRTNRALIAIAKVTALANKRSYDYTPDQALKVKNALEVAVDKLGKAFDSAGTGADSGFTL